MEETKYSCPNIEEFPVILTALQYKKWGLKNIQAAAYNIAYRISSNKTRGYYFFTRPSTAGIIRTRVLIQGWYYYQKFINLDIKTRKINQFHNPL